MQAGFGGQLKPPWLVQLLLVSVICVTSIWTIWPTFSGRVMRPRRSFTRAWTGAGGSRYTGLWLAEAVGARLIATPAFAPMSTRHTIVRAAPARPAIRETGRLRFMCRMLLSWSRQQD